MWFKLQNFYSKKKSWRNWNIWSSKNPSIVKTTNNYELTTLSTTSIVWFDAIDKSHQQLKHFHDKNHSINANFSNPRLMSTTNQRVHSTSYITWKFSSFPICPNIHKPNTYKNGMFLCLKQMGFCCQLALLETHYWFLRDHSHGSAYNLNGGPYI